MTTRSGVQSPSTTSTSPPRTLTERPSPALTTAAAAIKTAKAAGISTSSKVTFQVTDLLALVKHVAENPSLINLVAADEVRLRAYVKGLGTACNLPGVRVDVERTMAARAAA